MILVLPDFFGDGTQDLLAEGLNEALFDEVAVDDQTYFAHRCGPFEMADQLLLSAGEIEGRQFGQDGDAVVELDHAPERFQAACFVIEMTSFLARLTKFAKPDDLAAEAMSFFQQPQLGGIDILGQHIGLLIGGVLSGDIDQQFFVEKHLFADAVLLQRGDEDAHVDATLAKPGDHQLGC